MGVSAQYLSAMDSWLVTGSSTGLRAAHQSWVWSVHYLPFARLGRPATSRQPSPRCAGQPSPRGAGQPSPRCAGQPSPRCAGQPSPRCAGWLRGSSPQVRSVIFGGKGHTLSNIGIHTLHTHTYAHDVGFGAPHAGRTQGILPWATSRLTTGALVVDIVGSTTHRRVPEEGPRRGSLARGRGRPVGAARAAMPGRATAGA